VSGVSSTEAAAALRVKGYRVLPLPARAKEPPPKGWTEAIEPCRLEDDANIAIGTRGELAILITNDQTATEWATAQFGAPNVRTPRGGHWYFRARKGQANEANRETPVGTMELHVRNKYALVPPSVHPTGAAYQWEQELPPAVDLPECPDLRDLWHPHGKHHGELLRISAAKAHAGVIPQVAAAELVAWRDAHLPDPEAHPDRELVGMAESACQKFASPSRPSAGDRPSPARKRLFTAIQHERSGAPDEKVPDRAAFEEALAGEFHFAAPRDSQQLLVCRGGVYVSADTYVAAWVQERFEEERVPASTRFVSEVLASLRRRSYRDRDEFDPPYLLPLSNGYLDVRDRGFHPYDDTGDPLFTTRLDVPYDVAAKCLEFMRAVLRLFPRLAERIAFQEFCGYVLDPSQQFKVGCVVLGPPNIGKTAVLEGVQGALGDGATAAIALGDLCSSRFSARPLVGKIASIAPDLPYAPVEHTGLYKQITGGDHVNVEPKGGRPYRARLRVKFLFGANVLPRITTTDASVFGRFLVLVSTATPLPSGDRDRDLCSKLQAESAGILQWMLRGLELLQLTEGFNRDLLEQSERLWMESSDPIRAFVETCIAASPAARTSRADVLSALDEWVESNGLTLFDRDPAKSVASLIRRRFPAIQEQKGANDRWWVGIEIVRAKSGTCGRKSKLGGPGNKQEVLDTGLSSPEPTESGFDATAATKEQRRTPRKRTQGTCSTANPQKPTSSGCEGSGVEADGASQTSSLGEVVRAGGGRPRTTRPPPRPRAVPLPCPPPPRQPLLGVTGYPWWLGSPFRARARFQSYHIATAPKKNNETSTITPSKGDPTIHASHENGMERKIKAPPSPVQLLRGILAWCCCPQVRY
jgi:phage/plasmid-associated DNA primase